MPFDEDVGRLEIPMENTTRMHVGNSLTQRRRKKHQLLDTSMDVWPRAATADQGV
jgi:hypothetical protein